MSEAKLLQAALWYAAFGWYVFPCESNEKRPLTDHGYQDAIRGEATIRAWWAKWPQANIGIATGASGLVVVDCDVKHGALGLESWRELRAELDLDDNTPTVETPSGGLHVYYAAGEHTVRCSAGRLGEGLDVRAQGGYVVAPPSVTPAGDYGWALGCRPKERELLPLPPALAERLAEPKERETRPVPARTPADLRAEAARARAALQKLDPARADVYASWIEVGMCLCELGDTGLGLWDEWSAQSAKYIAGGCAEKWRTFTPADGLTLASLYRWAKEDAGEPSGDDRPSIDAGIQDLDRVTQLAWAILEEANEPPVLFVHGGQLVRLELGEPMPELVDLDVDRLRYEAARVARWYQTRKVDGLWEEVDARPPVVVMRNMLARPTGELEIPPVDRIVRSPVFAADGTLLRKPGYHAKARVIVCPDPDLEIPAIPARPAKSDVETAVKTIDDLLCDFPFTCPADRAHAFALLLGPLVRDMIAGPTPLHLVESATPGSGKGLLTMVLLTPALGEDVATMSAGRDDEEWRKRLTTVLRTGQPAVVIDNVRESIDAAPLSTALTTSWWDDRVLGASELLHLPVRCVWAATGNNPMLSTEIARRTIRIRIDPKMDQPWRREASQFTHAELLVYARERRGALLAAGLTLAQAWIAAGQPAANTPPLGSYEPWVRVIGGILAHAGIDGFLANLDELYERADSEGAVWRRFVAAWWEEHADERVGVAELYPLALELEAFPLGNGQERSQKIRLGKGLKEKEDVVLAGYRIEAAGTYKRLAQYRLQRTYTDDGVSGASGASPHPYGKTIMSDHATSGDIHQIHHIHQDDLALECNECGAPVTYYSPDGLAWCDKHGPGRDGPP